MQNHALERWRQHFFSQLESCRTFEPLFDRVPTAVFSIKDRMGRYVSISEGCVDRCHLETKEEALGKTAFDLFPHHMALRYHEQDQQLFTSGQPLIDSLDLTLFGDRSSGWCLTQKLPLYDRAGHIIGLACLSIDLIDPSRERYVDQHFADMIDFVRNHLAEGIRVEEMSQMARLSVSQLERRMRKIFQLTPGQFILKTRIELATHLLQHTSLSIADIALQVGFCDQSALTRPFKLITGVTPRQYREMLITPSLKF